MAISNYDLKIKKRIQLVHIAANELGLLDPKKHETDPDDEYHVILARWNRPGTRQPVTSSLQMNYQQLGELLDFLKALGFKIRRKATETRPGDVEATKEQSWKKYESSLAGLKQEVCSLAAERFGESWELPLNNLCRRFGVKRWQWLDVNHGKAVKAALLRLQNTAGSPQAEAKGDEDRREATEDNIPF